MNKAAFRWGRRAAVDPRRRRRRWRRRREHGRAASRSRRARSTRSSAPACKHLTGYQNAALCRALRGAGRATCARVEREGGAGQTSSPKPSRATTQAARLQGRIRGGAALRRGRLRSASSTSSSRATTSSSSTSRRRCSPRAIPRTGHLAEAGVRPLDAAGLPACWRSSKFLRGTALDLFGYTAERKAERRADRRIRGAGRRAAAGLTPDNHALAVELASIPEDIRGYGHVKEKALKDAKAKEAELLKAWHDPAKAVLWNAKQAAE